MPRISVLHRPMESTKNTQKKRFRALHSQRFYRYMLYVVRLTGIEPVAPTVSRWCSPSELQPLIRDIAYDITG